MSRKVFGGAALAAVVALAGCGSAKTASAPTPVAKATATPHQVASKLTHVRVAFPIFNLFTAPILLANKMGYFKAHGLKVTTVTLQGSPASNGALIGGSVQFAVTDSLGVFVADQKGAPLIAVGGMDRGALFTMAVGKAAAAKAGITPKEPIAKMLKAMKGWKIGVSSPAATPALMLQGLFTANHLPTNWVHFVGVSGSGMIAALQHGQIQGFFTDFPAPQTAQKDGAGFVAFSLGQVPAVSKMQMDVLITTKQYAASHSSLVKSMVAALAEANNELLHHPHQSVKALQSSFKGLSPKLLAQGLGQFHWEANAAMTTALWDQAQKLANQWHLVSKPISASGLKAAYTLKYLP